MDNTAEITAALTRFANSDMRLARNDGEIAICQTKAGTLSLAYNAAQKTYTLTPCTMMHNAAPLVLNGSAKETRAVLVANYNVG